ncbi:nicotinate-nucleotide--dimethylbenzimidazole phosphoribosyltransferase [Nonomuraea phyllanthi]|uniref:Nicotinate-nucleotide--dimethylbenzimidazole phosphoribosyltransferase n=1 Tax=Nonomuraea phyllanthi TaxID=2219224 RepID=A0A5C4VZE1_9ACTN|nr:nicotinate-nucleotide--dimethylbenzimidazole phosphoribosyltransferase [Nonomuraea phyllanthi]KAB8190863.1 nicotinate-nucleotide--dimethylbenzimidazole phosphoribosyltransferase [Nonomuraea phyllanthi]QFY11858.1 nicotinate-nucleotide--dimethylbenzimidazole phosphoribosyltransferase [Nonomuraea phyllanthi]
MLAETLAAIRPADPGAIAAARAYQDRLTKPRGSLGALEELAVRLAGAAGTSPPPMPEPAALAIFAGDHGVHTRGVTPWPQEVTVQMVANFLAGGAVANAFAAQAGVPVTVVDVGVAADLPDAPGLVKQKIAYGTDDLSKGPAMSVDQAVRALEAGITVARDLVASGARCLITGDMGIANTTASAALIAVFAGRDPAEVTGRGTGIDDATYQLKVDVVRDALRTNGLSGAMTAPSEALRALAAVGGFEHAALAGFILGGAAARVPVILDGVIAGAAALVAAALDPAATDHCVAGHRSAEPGHTVALDHLGLHPLVDLELRLGEGSGGLLAHPILCAAVRVMHDVATFDSAGVTEKPV